MTETMQSQHYAASMVSSLCADALIAAAVEAAARYGTAAVSVAVVDGSGLLKAFRRADEAAVLTIDIAMDKAWTAASSGLPTHTWNELFREHEQLTQLAHRPRLVAIAGGYPLLLENRVIGGIGISGGRHLQDRQIAEAAIRAAGLQLPANMTLEESNAMGTGQRGS